MPIWFRKNGGIWNNNALANPATGVGGISLSNVAGDTLFPTVQSSGSGSQICNFGASSFAFTPPAGFVGPPHGGGGFTTLDPAKTSGGTLSAGNLEFTSGSEQGLSQSVDGYTSGSYYFEIKCLGLSIFAVFIGGGVGRSYVGQSISFWFENGQFASGDKNGGALFSSTGFAAFEASLAAFSNLLVSDVFTYNTNDVVGIAFAPDQVPGATTADMADFWFSSTPGFVDLSQAANRRLFIDANGCPLYLGVNGQIPFGTAPPVFLTAATGNAASFALNNGLGGPFAVTGGSLSLSSGSPCCSIDDTAQFNVPLGSDPQVRMSMSDDGGRTWNLVTKNRTLGRIGKYLTRLRWLKLGQFRQRIIKLEITDPVKRAFVGFYVDNKEGMK